MKRIITTILCMITGVICHAEKLKVACVGDSITYGSCIEDRENYSYPAQLQNLLGQEYDVRNFGVSGTTLLHKGNYPYISTEEYRKSLEFNPDIVLIKLGTNDSKPQNRVHLAEYKQQYELAGKEEKEAILNQMFEAIKQGIELPVNDNSGYLDETMICVWGADDAALRAVLEKYLKGKLIGDYWMATN